MRNWGRRRALAAAVLVSVTGLVASHSAIAGVFDPVGRHDLCGAQDLPETGLQGDVPKVDQESGRARLGYNCGLSLVGHTVLDADGRQSTGNANMAWTGDCAYVAGPGALFGEPDVQPGHGVAVVDVSDPTAPRHVRTLRTPGALATIETLHAVETADRAVLVVGQYGNVFGENRPMDVYDVSDCAAPRLLTTFRFPRNIHNLTISGNGRYVFATQPLQVVDLEPLFDADPGTDAVYLGNLEEATPYPLLGVVGGAELERLLPPELRGLGRPLYLSHEAWPSDDGTRLYVGGQLPTFEVLSVLDLTDWLARDAGGAPVGPPRVISQRGGRGHSIRTAAVDGGARRLLLHSEESVFGLALGCLPETLNPVAGAAEAWLTDITDEANPRRVSELSLEINRPINCLAQLDSGVQASVHYHDVDDPDDTTFAMLSMWNAGLRIFDVRDPEAPVEVAYFNPADVGTDSVVLDAAWGHVRYVPETGHIWFATSSGGFWVVELEPQVRAHLGLDDAPTVRSPDGRAAATGTARPAPSVLADLASLYCTLGVAGSITSRLDGA